MAKRARKPSVAEFVLDGSLALAWYFKDEADPYADAVAARFPAVRALVPLIWPWEVANALLTGERRQRCTEAQATKWLTYLRSLPIAVDDETNDRAWSEVLGLGRTHRLSAYDAAYLELALRRGLPLATLDDRLKSAASAVGVLAFAP
ncbi:MAG TPA: type II toxin-antitoxin system VapC family toxin [Terriglobia bacterium]|nr:type II toxin-antitoxin system VapC family toxin [Terriglobia bacterium]